MAGNPPAIRARSGLTKVGGLDFGLSVRIKDAFFDRDKVIKAVEKGKLRALSKIGAYVRRRAQTSIRYRKKSSPPGKPPSGHKSGAYTRPKLNKKTGVTTRQQVSPLRDLIWFAYDADTSSVVVGPILFKGATKQDPPAPELLEHGGEVTRRTRKGVTRTYKYRGNPFMGPALAAELPRARQQFKDFIR